MSRWPPWMRRSSRLIAAAPAPVVDDGLEAEAGETIGQLLQAALDLLGKAQPILGVQPLEFLFRQRLLFLARARAVPAAWPRLIAFSSRS